MPLKSGETAAGGTVGPFNAGTGCSDDRFSKILQRWNARQSHVPLVSMLLPRILSKSHRNLVLSVTPLPGLNTLLLLIPPLPHHSHKRRPTMQLLPLIQIYRLIAQVVSTSLYLSRDPWSYSDEGAPPKHRRLRLKETAQQPKDPRCYGC